MTILLMIKENVLLLKNKHHLMKVTNVTCECEKNVQLYHITVKILNGSNRDTYFVDQIKCLGGHW